MIHGHYLDEIASQTISLEESLSASLSALGDKKETPEISLSPLDPAELKIGAAVTRQGEGKRKSGKGGSGKSGRGGREHSHDEEK